MTIANEPGNLGSLTTTIGKQGGNISNLKITNRSQDFISRSWWTSKLLT